MNKIKKQNLLQPFCFSEVLELLSDWNKKICYLTIIDA